MCHISHGHVSYGHLNVRQDYDFVLLEDYGESRRNILPLLLYDPDIEIVLFFFGKRLNNNVTVLSFTAADNQDLLFQITVLTCPRPT